MTDIISIAHLHKDFSTIAEWKEFAEKQFLTINFLHGTIDQLKEEIAQLKKIPTQGPVDKIIVSPERALLDEQIYMIQQRSYAKELSLEDVKKLDLLLKNMKIIKEADAAIKTTSKKLELSSDELLKIVQDGK